MKPADAYIRDFIKDINRSKVIELRSIMNKKVKGSGKGLTLDMTIDEALPILNTSKNNSFSVIDNNNKVLGSVNLDSAINALAKDNTNDVAERYK